MTLTLDFALISESARKALCDLDRVCTEHNGTGHDLEAMVHGVAIYYASLDGTPDGMQAVLHDLADDLHEIAACDGVIKSVLSPAKSTTDRGANKS